MSPMGGTWFVTSWVTKGPVNASIAMRGRVRAWTRLARAEMLGPCAEPLLVVVVLVASGCPGAAHGAAYVPGELIVRFAPGVDARERADLRREAPTCARSSALPRAPACSSCGCRGRLGARRRSRCSSASARSLYAEPNALLRAARGPGRRPVRGAVGAAQHRADGERATGVADADIDAPEAWDTTTGSAGRHGGDRRHRRRLRPPRPCREHLDATRARAAAARRPTASTTTANGFIDDFRGWDFSTATTTRWARTSTGPPSPASSEGRATTGAR